MERNFNIGDRIVCITTGVIGKCIDFYTPTACAEQTMILTDDGKRYHAPTYEWELTERVCPRGYEGEELLDSKSLNPYGKYLVEFAKHHGMTILEASEEPMVKARLELFLATGM